MFFDLYCCQAEGVLGRGWIVEQESELKPHNVNREQEVWNAKHDHRLNRIQVGGDDWKGQNEDFNLFIAPSQNCHFAQIENTCKNCLSLF